MQSEHHYSVKCIKTGLNLINILITTIAQLYNKRQHLVILSIVNRELRTLKESAVQIDDILQQHSINVKMPALTLTFFIHHTNEISKPIEFLVFLLRSEIESFDIVFLNHRQRASVGTDDILYLPTFSDKVATNLPPIFKDITTLGKTPTEKDMLLLASITILSGAFPEVFAIYDDMRVYPNLFTFLVANAASGKGRTSACLKLVSLIEQEIREANKQEVDDYQQQLADLRALGNKKSVAMPMPKEPPYRSMLIPANCSSTAIYQALHDNHDQGITFETEADSLANTLKSDYGNFSDGLRKGFHHEDITYRRRKENEHVEIHNPKWTVYLTGTPGQVNNLIPSPENGLFSRFLFMKVDIPAKWHNVFSKAKRTINEEMEAIGKRVFRIHQHLVASKSMKPKTGQSYSNDILFELTDAQGEQFNKYFDSLVEEYKNMLGRDFVASIYRLGLSTFRIAMVLSIARLEETLSESPTTSISENATTSIICRDEDLDNAITIADTLMQHAAKIFATLMPNKEEDGTLGIKLSPKSERLFENLPDKFNRQTVLSIGKKLGIPQRTAEKYVGEYVNKHGLCKRTGNGEYEKVKQQNADERSLLPMLGKC